MTKETLNVKVNFASEERILHIQSHQGEREDGTLFSVSSGSETLGVLHKSDDRWQWAEGTRSYEEASAIGAEIDSHFNR